MTSANRASDGARFRGSACRRTNERSSELAVVMRAPRVSSSSAILNVSRVVVPSSSRSSASEAAPACAAESAA